MFEKVLIANRGEIAVRIVRTCREMGIEALALYEAPDRGSLHVRLADECAELASPHGFFDGEEILRIAQEKGADAIHPGYGYLAERPSFVRACEAAGITFIGPPAAVVETLNNKPETLARVRAAGFPTVESSPMDFGDDELEALADAAEELDYPLVVKACRSGRGPGERLVHKPENLMPAVRHAQARGQAVFGSRRLYLERAVLPAQQIAVQIVADGDGRIVHLGEREGSLQYGSRKVVEESPSPHLSQAQREEIWETAVAIARHVNYENAGTVEFLIDKNGDYYFTEIKSRLQVDHPLSEIRSNIDLVEIQLLLAAGRPLPWTQEEITLSGWAMLSRINAEDPWNHFLPAPGPVGRVRLPGGPAVRVDTYVYCRGYVPPDYDPMVAKLTVWGETRRDCLQRMRRALEDFTLTGRPTNVPLLQHIIHMPQVTAGRYDTEILTRPTPQPEVPNLPHRYQRDMAVAAAVYYLRRNQMLQTTLPDRVFQGWHRASRRVGR